MPFIFVKTLRIFLKKSVLLYCLIVKKLMEVLHDYKHRQRFMHFWQQSIVRNQERNKQMGINVSGHRKIELKNNTDRFGVRMNRCLREYNGDNHHKCKCQVGRVAKKKKTSRKFAKWMVALQKSRPTAPGARTQWTHILHRIWNRTKKMAYVNSCTDFTASGLSLLNCELEILFLCIPLLTVSGRSRTD